jgi:uncharacterized cupin superfamily protein
MGLRGPLERPLVLRAREQRRADQREEPEGRRPDATREQRVLRHARATRSNMKRPALDPSDVTPRSSSGYPEPFRSRVIPRQKRPLGSALGLTKIGVNLTTLPPGKESSMRHFHSHEEELVFVLEGELVLRTNEGEQILTAGTCAGFALGTRNGHQLVNRSDKPARYLEISNRDADDTAEYPDDDLAYHKAADGSAVFTHKDGSPY